MKRMSQIAKELRANGRKFSQTSLMKNLTEFKPVFKEGKVIFYADEVTDILLAKYKVRGPIVIGDPGIPVQNKQLDKIQKMLEAICKSFELEVT